MKHLLQFFATTFTIVAIFTPRFASAQCSGGTVSPAAALVCSGGSQVFTVTGASGTLQWMTSPTALGPWTNVAGGTNGTLTLTGITSTISVQVQADSSGCPLQFSNTVSVTPSTTPVVTVQSLTSASAEVTWFPSWSNQFNITWTGAGTGTQVGVTSPWIVTGLNPGAPLCVTVTPMLTCPGVFSGQSCLADTNLYILDTIITNTICSQLNGAIDVTVDGGIPPYSFLWSNGATNEDQEFLAAGIYTLTTTDANGNTLDALFNINNEMDTLDIIFVETPGTGGLFNVEAVLLNGTSPYDYSWNGGVFTDDILIDVPAGLYNVTVTDANGCGGTGSYTVGLLCGYDVSFSYALSGNVLNAEVTNVDPGLTYTWLTNVSPQTYSGDFVSFAMATPYDNILCLSASDGVCIQNSCETLVFSSAAVDSLSGVVWNDGNGNGILDNGELPISDAIVKWINDADSTLFGTVAVNPDGSFAIALLPGTYTISAYNPSSSFSQSFPLSPIAYTVFAIGGVQHQNLNFGFQYEGAIITGRVFFDVNSDGAMDSTEAGIGNMFVHAAGLSITTDQDGFFAINVPVGSVINVSFGLAGWTPTTPSSYPVSADSAGFAYGPFMFGIVALPQDLHVQVIKLSNAVPGFTAKYRITCTNYGTSAISGSVSFTTHPSFIPVATSVSWTPDYNAADTTFTNLLPGESVYFYAWYDVPVLDTLGTPIVASAVVSPFSGDGNLTNNIDTFFHNIVGSYDPNDKSVSPPGSGANGAIDPDNVKTLTYVIRFQNTGTYHATNVILVDTLSPHLDWNSLQMNGASHNYTAQLNDTTGVLTFFFNNIMLPDSNTNEPESHGYAQFEINLDSTLALGAVIENFADIYFDFNEPVRTNTAVNTLEEEVIIAIQQPVPHQGVHVYPNPAVDKVFWRVDTPTSNSFIDVYNSLGVNVASLNVGKNGLVELDRGALPSGMYTYALHNSGFVVNGTVVLE